MAIVGRMCVPLRHPMHSASTSSSCKQSSDHGSGVHFSELSQSIALRTTHLRQLSTVGRAVSSSSRSQFPVLFTATIIVRSGRMSM